MTAPRHVLNLSDLGPDGLRRVLEAGDCLGFGPPAETVFANEDERPCTYVVALARG